jgi:hypothetical protein
MFIVSSIVFIAGTGIGVGLGYGLGLFVDEWERRNGVLLLPWWASRTALHGLRGLLMQFDIPR